MGERGSAPEVILIRIFAYPGYKRDINDEGHSEFISGECFLRVKGHCEFFCRCFLRFFGGVFYESCWRESSRRILVLGPVAVYVEGGRAFCQVPG